MKNYLFASIAALLVSTAVAQAGTSGWALVNAEGKIVHGINATSHRLDVGKYIVRFSNDVSLCAISATISGRTDAPGQIVTIDPRPRSQDVYVSTYRPNGNQPADYRFYVLALCL